MIKCPTCDGTGEVHSHNPKCWDCHGKGTITEEKVKELEKIEKRIKQIEGISKIELLNASIEFFSWYNKTYQNQPSNHPDHPWCKLGKIISNLNESER